MCMGQGAGSVGALFLHHRPDLKDLKDFKVLKV
jgi:hypothetical protein